MSNAYQTYATGQARRFFGTPTNSDDILWTEWVNFKKRGSKDLKELIAADVRDEFKARALAILLVPSLRLAPYRWNFGHNSAKENFLFQDLLDFRQLPEKQLRFAAELIIGNVDYVESEYTEQDKEYETLHHYNLFIISLLGILPVDDDLANSLSARFVLNDPVPFCDMDESSGYRPFHRLIADEQVPEYWKERADKGMREVILSELSGKTHPRVEWEQAVRRYVEHITLPLVSNKLYYSDKLFISQLEFLLGLSKGREYVMFSSFQMPAIFSRLPKVEYSELRHRLARHVVLGKLVDEFYRFSVHDSATNVLAKQFVREFKRDSELCAKLESMLESYARKAATNNEAAAYLQTAEQALFARMK